MIKRPLNIQFREAVLEDRKITTIRRTPWPIGVPIMLYNWEGAPYRSKHLDVAPVVVEERMGIGITHRPDGSMGYDYADPIPRALWVCEGFESQWDMDTWFRSALRVGETAYRFLMRFNRVGSAALPCWPPANDADGDVGAPKRKGKD